MATKGPKATSKFLCFLLRDRLVALALDVLRVGAGLLRLGVQQLVGLGAQGEVDVFADLCGNVTYEVSWKRTLLLADRARRSAFVSMPSYNARCEQQTARKIWPVRVAASAAVMPGVALTCGRKPW